MKNFLKICDLYGERFHWFIWYKPKYYTYYGGIFSIFSFLAFIAVFIFFGYDDFKRKNPISNISTTPPLGYKNIRFGQEKLYLPWRIIDYDENPINITGKIYPRIFYFSVQPDNITGQLQTKYNLVNYKLCNETSMKYLGGEYIIDIPLETLYCIDMEELNMGGSWNSDFINFIRFDLYMCEDGIDYNESNHKCTTYENLQNIYGGGESIFFELLYPVVQFQPTNQNIPILIIYKTLYYIVNKFSSKLDRMYLQEYIFEDEKGWIFNSPINQSYWGVSTINGESYIIGDKDIMRFGSTSRLYTINFYFDLGIVFYTRKYKKLYEILGEVFPIISGVSSIFAFISRIINELQSTKKLNEFITGIDRLQSIKLRSEMKNRIKSSKKLKRYDSIINNNNNRKKNYIININKKNNVNKEEISNKLNPNSNFLNDSSKVSCFSNSINFNQLKDTKKFNLNPNFNEKNNFNINRFNLLKSAKKARQNYPINFYFFGFIMNKIDIHKGNFRCITKQFNKSFSFYRYLIDITSYITLHQQFELLKKMITNNWKLGEAETLKNLPKIEYPNNQFLTEDNNIYNINNINLSVNRSIKPIELKIS